MDLLEVADREEWRRWLARHRHDASEVWLVFPKAHTGRPRVSYNDAVEEALAVGWIDSTAKRVDEDRFAQRFTPRRPGRPYSQANKERLRALASAGRLAPDVLESVRDVLEEEFVVPRDILAAIRADRGAWEEFQALSPSYVRIRIAFIDGARKRPAEFAKRLDHFIRMTAKGKTFGFGGIDKYY